MMVDVVGYEVNIAEEPGETGRTRVPERMELEHSWVLQKLTAYVRETAGACMEEMCICSRKSPPTPSGR